MTGRLTWPASRFYWAELEGPPIRRPGPLPPGPALLFQDDVPVEVAALHAVAAPLPEGRLAVCAAARSDLAELPASTIALTPESLPPHLDGRGLTPESFDLLVGDFEPAPLRRRRLGTHALAAAATLLCGLFVAAGLDRRAAHWDATAAAARGAAARLLASVAPGRDAGDLAAELTRLQTIRQGLAIAPPPRDASLVLASVLDAWPASVPSAPQSLSVGPAGVVLSVAVEGEASAFLGEFRAPPGWTMEEPRLNASGRVTRLSLRLRALEAAP